MQYRRDQTPGATYFFTLVTGGRQPLFAAHDNIARLRDAFAQTRSAQPFHVEAMVLLPDHLHCLWTLPEGDAAYPLRWNRIKGAFTRSLPEADKPPRNAGRRERAVWQRRYWEHRIRDETDFARHCDYIHWNPVKHGLVERPEHWPHSTYARFAAAGIYPPMVLLTVIVVPRHNLRSAPCLLCQGTTYNPAQNMAVRQGKPQCRQARQRCQAGRFAARSRGEKYARRLSAGY